jgi:hypothetical protein
MEIKNQELLLHPCKCHSILPPRKAKGKELKNN